MMIKKQLYYHYKSKCPTCNIVCDHYVIIHNFRQDCDTSIQAEGNCKCGYKGVVDLKYKGRIFKPYTTLINPHLVDPT